MSSMRSPVRKGPSGPPARPYGAPAKKIEAGEVNELASLVEEFKAINLNTKSSFEALDRVVLGAKINDQDIQNLLGAIGHIDYRNLTAPNIASIADFLNRFSRTVPSCATALKCAESESILSLLLMETIRLHYEAENDSKVYGQIDGLTSTILLLVHSHPPQTLAVKSAVCTVLLTVLRQCKPPAVDPLCDHCPNVVPNLLDALGCVAALSPTAKDNTTSASQSLNKNTALLVAEVGVSAAGTVSDLQGKVVQILGQFFHSAQTFLSQLPASSTAQKGSDAAGSIVEDIVPEQSGALYKATVQQLQVLLASLRALSAIFAAPTSSGNKSASSSTNAEAEILLRGGLVPALDKLLRNVMPTLGKRLASIAEEAERAALLAAPAAEARAGISPGVTPPASILAPAPAAAPPAKVLLGKTAAYRPPSQRNEPATSSNRAPTGTVNTTGAPVTPVAGTSNPPRSAALGGAVAVAAAAAAPGVVSADGTTTGKVGSTYTATMADLKSQLSAQVLTLLGNLAALNPGTFVNSWSLFFTDVHHAEEALRQKALKLIALSTGSSSSPGGDGNSSAPVHAPAPLLVASMVTRTSVARTAPSAGGSARINSPILGTMLHSATVSVRAAAVMALLKCLAGLPLRAVFTTTRPGAIGRIETRSSSTSRVSSAGSLFQRTSASGLGSGGTGAHPAGAPKQLTTLLKVFDTLIVALDSEQDGGVVELLLKLAALLLDQVPLSEGFRTDRALRFGAVGSGASLYDAKATTLYVLVMRIALRFEVTDLGRSLLIETATPSSNALPAVNPGKTIIASYVALVWLADQCRKASHTSSLLHAMQLPVLPASIAAALSCGRGFLHAAAHVLLRAIPPIVTNNLYCVAVRGANTALAQYFPALLLQDAQWLRNLLQVLEMHAQSGLRLQGSKMLGFLLEHDLPNMVANASHVPLQGNYLSDKSVGTDRFAATIAQCTTVVRSLQENYACILKSCSDDAHIVRTQALLTVGSLTSYVWRVLQGVPCTSAEMLLCNSALHAELSLSKRQLLLRCLLVGAGDSVGTVRTAAFKSLGDSVVNNSLLLSAAAVDVTAYESLVDSRELKFMNDLIACLATGILDSKLSVRVQAAWALGNVIVTLLPYRWAYGGTAQLSVGAGTSAPSTTPFWLQDACWMALFGDLVPLLHDSEKLAATAIRCVGNIAAGLFPATVTLHRETVCALHENLIQRYLLPEYAAPEERGGFDWLALSSLREHVLGHSQKVTFSLSQSMGFVMHALCAGVGEDAHSPYVTEVMEVQLSFLKYGKLKVQLQALQVLLYGICLQRGGDKGSGIERAGQLVRTLECLLALCPITLPAKNISSIITSSAPRFAGEPRSPGQESPSTGNRTGEATTSTVGTAERADAGGAQEGIEEVREEVVQLFRSRAAELLHYHVLLLHVVLGELWRASTGAGESGENAAVPQYVRELLLFYGEDLARWAEALHPTATGVASAQVVYNSSNTTVGLPHVRYPVCDALQCQGRTHQALVAEIAVLVLRFSTAAQGSATSAMVADRTLQGSALQRLPSLSIESLPAALTARIMGIAATASPSYRRELFDGANIGTSGVLGGGYGVFDGLDVQSYLHALPAAQRTAAPQSPKPSPTKALVPTSPASTSSARHAEAAGVSSVLGYVVQTEEGVDEDEF